MYIVVFAGWGPSHKQAADLQLKGLGQSQYVLCQPEESIPNPCLNGHVVQWESGRLAQRGYTFPPLLLSTTVWGQEA